MQTIMDKVVEPLRFIPYRRADIVAMLVAEGSLPVELRDRFSEFAEELARRLHEHYYGILEKLKQAYALSSPQEGLRDSQLLDEQIGDIKTLLTEVLTQANYEQLSQKDLRAALREASLFRVRLKVDFSRFQEAVIFSRGQSQRTEQLTLFWGLYKKPVTFTHFKRVVLYLKLSGDGEKGERIYLKMFEDVPKADIEMLFPDTEVQMRLVDKLLIGVPALVSGGVVLTTKLGTTLLLLGSLFGFWLGLHAEPVALNKAALIALLAGLGALGGFIWKQIKNFRTRKLEFAQALTRNLYFKNVANNSSVLYQLIDDAEEEESKEILLAYYFLLVAAEPLTAKMLDERIEGWFAERWGYVLDFEISDALRKLAAMQLATQQDNRWSAAPLNSH